MDLDELGITHIDCIFNADQSDYMTNSFAEAVRAAVAEMLANGHPVARYDWELNKVYMEYPDGHIEYCDTYLDII